MFSTILKETKCYNVEALKEILHGVKTAAAMRPVRVRNDSSVLAKPLYISFSLLGGYTLPAPGSSQ